MWLISRKTDGNGDNRSVACRLTDSVVGATWDHYPTYPTVANLSSYARLPGVHTTSVRANCIPLSLDQLIDVWAIPIYGPTIIFS